MRPLTLATQVRLRWPELQDDTSVVPKSPSLGSFVRAAAEAWPVCSSLRHSLLPPGGCARRPAQASRREQGRPVSIVLRRWGAWGPQRQ